MTKPKAPKDQAATVDQPALDSFGPAGITGQPARYHTDDPNDEVARDIRARLVEFLPRLRRFACSLTGDRDRGEDLVQDTCARALAHLDQWQPGTRLDSWMFRIAQNLWLDRARAEKSRGEVVDLDTVGDLPSSDGRAVTESRLTLEEVRRSMAALSADQRVLIGLVCVDGLSYNEAAEVLNERPGTIMSRLARARVALYEAIYGKPRNET